jgi:hypothetical protein
VKQFLARLWAFAQRRASTVAGILRTQLATEPVRVRAWLVSALVALGAVIPALADGGTVQIVASLLLAIAPVLLGEGARARVTPVGTPRADS